MDESWPRSPLRVSGARADAHTDLVGLTDTLRALARGAATRRAWPRSSPRPDPAAFRAGPRAGAPRTHAPGSRAGRARVPAPGLSWSVSSLARQGKKDVAGSRGPGWGARSPVRGLSRPDGGVDVANVVLPTHSLGAQERRREPLGPATSERTPPESCGRSPPRCPPFCPVLSFCLGLFASGTLTRLRSRCRRGGGV